MFLRNVLAPAFILAAIVCAPREARADWLPSSSALWKPLPPQIDTSSGRGVRGLFDRVGRSCFRVPFAMHERAFRERSGEALGRELSTSLGVRSRGFSVFGASGAAAGAVTWVLTQRKGERPVLSIVPRLFSGGGGIGVMARW